MRRQPRGDESEPRVFSHRVARRDRDHSGAVDYEELHKQLRKEFGEIERLRDEAAARAASAEEQEAAIRIQKLQRGKSSRRGMRRGQGALLAPPAPIGEEISTSEQIT